MQHENVLANNVISLVGVIVSDFTFSHRVYGEGFYNFNIEVVRLSQVSDTLSVAISERLVDKNTLPIGTQVHILGQIRSYNSFTEGDRRNKLILTVFVREIEKLDDMLNMNPNDVYLDGFICKPPVYRTTPFGREITDLLLAINRSYNKSDYIPCITWGRNARFAGKLAVGDNVKIYGRMQSRNYQKKYENGDVIDRVAYEVSVSKLEYANYDENGEQVEEDEVGGSDGE